MTGTRPIRNLALIGFMGTGKSSVGRLAAHLLDFSFLDTDHEIEMRAGKPIASIFKEDGEPAFREWEKEIVRELATKEKTLIATGGGLPVNPENLESLKRHALVVCLWASPEIILDRVQGHSHRPLLNEPEPLERIRELLSVREPCYRQADVLINTEWRSVKEVAAQVVHQFQLAYAAQA